MNQSFEQSAAEVKNALFGARSFNPDEVKVAFNHMLETGRKMAEALERPDDWRKGDEALKLYHGEGK